MTLLFLHLRIKYDCCERSPSNIVTRSPVFVFILQQAWGLVISNRGEGEGHKSVHDGGDGGSLAANYLAAPCRRRWSHHCVAAEASLHGDGGKCPPEEDYNDNL